MQHLAKKTFTFFLVLFLGIQACTSQTPGQGNAPASVPEFTFYTLKGNKPVSRTSLALQGNIVFVFFDPGCSHCRVDIKAMGDNYERIKSANLYLISQNDPILVNEFMDTFGKGLKDKPNVLVLLDPSFQFINIFQPVQYPAVYVYGQDRKLKTYFDGEKPAEFIIEALNK